MKYRIAIGSRDRIQVTEHFGQCERFYIVEVDEEKNRFLPVEDRETKGNIQCGNHMEDYIRNKIEALMDCRFVLVKQIGGQSEKLLNHSGITVFKYGGFIEDALKKIIKFYKKDYLQRKE
ncbi:MAG: Nitro-FeMo-Co domain-containing protein [Lachnoclostridium sp.]